MKRLLFLGGCLLSLPIWAAQQVDETIDADPAGYVEIKNTAGRIEVKSWDKDQVRVVGQLDELTEKFIFERNGNQVLIQVKIPKHSNRRNVTKEDGDNLVIYLPEQSHVIYTSVNSDYIASDYRGGSDISLVNGDISLTELQGRLRVNTVNGDIRSQGLSGDIVMETVNGDIKDQGSSGNRLAYQTVNGDISAQTSIADVMLETVNGDMDVTLSGVKSVESKTVNGELSLAMTLLESAEVQATSVGGEIHLRFMDELSARFDIQAHAGGNITNNVSNDKVQKNKYGPHRWLNFSVSDGSSRVGISTVNGKIILDKK